MRKVVVALDSKLSADELLKAIRGLSAVKDVVEYDEDSLADVLYFIGIRIWKMEKRGDVALEELRHEIEVAIGEDFRRFPK